MRRKTICVGRVNRYTFRVEFKDIIDGIIGIHGLTQWNYIEMMADLMMELHLSLLKLAPS